MLKYFVDQQRAGFKPITRSDALTLLYSGSGKAGWKTEQGNTKVFNKGLQ